MQAGGAGSVCRQMRAVLQGSQISLVLGAATLGRRAGKGWSQGNLKGWQPWQWQEDWQEDRAKQIGIARC